MPRPGSGGPTASKLTIKGTRGDDVITVVSGGVLINGSFKPVAQSKLDAGLVLKGDLGNDTISGGPAADTLDGGGGNDWLKDGLNSVFIGGAGNDTVDLSQEVQGFLIDIQGTGAIDPGAIVNNYGDGYLYGSSSGASTIYGTVQGVENVIGGAGNDWIVGNNESNILRGGDGDDIVSAVQSDGVVDFLFGDDGEDNLFAGSGNDQLTGGADRDTFGFDPTNRDGNWVVTDYSATDHDRVVLFPYEGGLTWSYNGSGWAVANLDGGDTITFVGVTDFTIIDLASSMSWPPQ